MALGTASELAPPAECIDLERYPVTRFAREDVARTRPLDQAAATGAGRGSAP